MEILENSRTKRPYIESDIPFKRQYFSLYYDITSIEVTSKCDQT